MRHEASNHGLLSLLALRVREHALIMRYAWTTDSPHQRVDRIIEVAREPQTPAVESERSRRHPSSLEQ
jgi:hypothetical protein